MASLAGSLIDRIKVNATQRVTRDGRAFWIKRRRATATPVLICANAFFKLADAPLRTLPAVAAWQQWEVDCVLRIHGHQFQAFSPDPRSIAVEEMPGTNLTDYLDSATITPTMCAAAGRELRRAHQLPCPQLAGLWSHGDPHLGNFLYDGAADRARIIDFEVMHQPSLSEPHRHADDLLVFLQDMAGRIHLPLWLPCAQAFLAGYDAPSLTDALLPQLARPPAALFARLWWNVRVGSLPQAELQRRFDALLSACRA